MSRFSRFYKEVTNDIFRDDNLIGALNYVEYAYGDEVMRSQEFHLAFRSC
jgi:hypothetical protein